MAVEPTGAGDLRDRLRFERRAADDNDALTGEWLPLIVRRAARLTPTRGGQEVQAQRAAGVILYDGWVRFSSDVLALDSDCRAVDLRDETRTFDVLCRPMDLSGRRMWLLVQLRQGSAEG